MPFRLCKGYFQKGKGYEKESVQILIQLPIHYFDVANMLDMNFGKLQKWISGKGCQNAANVVCPFCGDARGKASICVCAEGKSLMFSIALIVELVIIC